MGMGSYKTYKHRMICASYVSRQGVLKTGHAGHCLKIVSLPGDDGAVEGRGTYVSPAKGKLRFRMHDSTAENGYECLPKCKNGEGVLKFFLKPVFTGTILTGMIMTIPNDNTFQAAFSRKNELFPLGNSFR